MGIVGNEAARARARTLLDVETTLGGAEEEFRARDKAYHTLIESSTTTEEWEETARYIAIARRGEDLRERVRRNFIKRCQNEQLVEATLSDPPRQQLPSVTPLSVLKDIARERRAKYRKKKPIKTSIPAA